MSGKTDLKDLLQNMNPKLKDGEYVFCTLPPDSEPSSFQSLMQFKEKEGITLIVEKKEADKTGLKYETVFSWITLTVHSSLESYGLTAVISTTLAEQEIACNIVAGYYHDHLFVPKGDAGRVLSSLKELIESQKTSEM